jgi:hypothetical protein
MIAAKKDKCNSIAISFVNNRLFVSKKAVCYKVNSIFLPALYPPGLLRLTSKSLSLDGRGLG